MIVLNIDKFDVFTASKSLRSGFALAEKINHSKLKILIQNSTISIITLLTNGCDISYNASRFVHSVMYPFDRICIHWWTYWAFHFCSIQIERLVWTHLEYLQSKLQLMLIETNWFFFSFDFKAEEKNAIFTFQRSFHVYLNTLIEYKFRCVAKIALNTMIYIYCTLSIWVLTT